jgi:hypothetical protein
MKPIKTKDAAEGSPLERLMAKAASGKMDRRELLDDLRAAALAEMRTYIDLDPDPVKREAARTALQKVNAAFTLSNTFADAMMREYEGALYNALESNYALSMYLDTLRALVEAIAVKVGAAKRSDGEGLVLDA